MWKPRSLLEPKNGLITSPSSAVVAIHCLDYAHARSNECRLGHVQLEDGLDELGEELVAARDMNIEQQQKMGSIFSGLIFSKPIPILMIR